MSEKAPRDNSADLQDDSNRIDDTEKAHAMALASERTNNIFDAKDQEERADYLYDLNPDKCAKMTAEEFKTYMNQYRYMVNRSSDAQSAADEWDQDWAKFEKTGEIPDDVHTPSELFRGTDAPSPEFLYNIRASELANQVGIAHANYQNAQEYKARFYTAYADPSTDEYKKAAESLATIEKQKEEQAARSSLPFEDTRENKAAA